MLLFASPSLRAHHLGCLVADLPPPFAFTAWAIGLADDHLFPKGAIEVIGAGQRACASRMWQDA
jgi:hypothetical protein